MGGSLKQKGCFNKSPSACLDPGALEPRKRQGCFNESPSACLGFRALEPSTDLDTSKGPWGPWGPAHITKKIIINTPT